MEHVTIKFPEMREVMLDGELIGRTNTTLRVEEGTHTFSLDGASDYQPISRTMIVARTTPVIPREVTFVKAPAST